LEKIDVLIVIYELPNTEVFKIGLFRFDEHFSDHFIQFHAPKLLAMHLDWQGMIPLNNSNIRFPAIHIIFLFTVASIAC